MKKKKRRRRTRIRTRTRPRRNFSMDMSLWKKGGKHDKKVCIFEGKKKTDINL